MNRPFAVGVKLNKDENTALTIWANSMGLEKGTLMRHAFRLALREIASTGLLPSDLITALQIQQSEQQ